MIAEKGGGLALRMKVRRGIKGIEWKLTLEPASAEVIMVDGVPILADQQSLHHLEDLIIDWVQTPAGPGFGVMDRNFQQRDLKMGAD